MRNRETNKAWEFFLVQAVISQWLTLHIKPAARALIQANALSRGLVFKQKVVFSTTSLQEKARTLEILLSYSYLKVSNVIEWIFGSKVILSIYVKRDARHLRVPTMYS